MEAYSSSSSTSASSRQQMPHYVAALHAVRRDRGRGGFGSGAKPWKKQAVAPLPPVQPRVYKVDPVNFRDLVQRLTAAPEFSSSAPPPPVQPQPRAEAKPAFLSSAYKEFSDVLVPAQPPPQHGGGFLGLNLSPPTNNATSYNWCSYPMLSPGTMSSLEHSSVL